MYNECSTIEETLRRVAEVSIEKEIIIVDDGSYDGTAERIERAIGTCPASTEVVRWEETRGKGAAVRAGFARARGRIVLIQDADLEYDPSDYGRLLEPILAGLADVVYGSRFLGGPQRKHMFWHQVGNRGLTLLSNALNDINLTDMETGFKVFTREVVDAIGPALREDRFGIEPELTARVVRHGFRIYEVPIAYHGRDYDAGKKITWRDGVAAIAHVVRYRFFD